MIGRRRLNDGISNFKKMAVVSTDVIFKDSVLASAIRSSKRVFEIGERNSDGG